MKKPGNGTIKTYLASTGATGALVAGALIAFLAVGALVAFDGFPLGGDDAEGTVSLAEQPGGVAPESAAAALAGGPGAVAADPVGGTVIAAVLPGTGAGGTGAGPGGEGPGGPGGPEPLPPPGSGGGGPITDVVNGIDEDTGLGLGETAGPLPGQVDRALNDTLNDVGGLLGDPDLGDDVANGVRGLSDGLRNGGLLGGGR